MGTLHRYILRVASVLVGMEVHLPNEGAIWVPLRRWGATGMGLQTPQDLLRPPVGASREGSKRGHLGVLDPPKCAHLGTPQNGPSWTPGHFGA